MLQAIIFLILGLAILIVGAEFTVRGSASLAKKLKISSLVIGLTVVAFGTSAPELIVNIFSAFRGSSDIAIGNIIGSNIANILLILGLASLIFPITVKRSTVWYEIPLALLGVVLIFVMGNDQLLDKVGFSTLTRTDGLTLMAIFLIFMIYIVSLAKKGKVEEEEVKTYSWIWSIVMVLCGLFSLCFGGKILVDNAIILAQLAGLSEAFIGLTIVAVGTSLSELATSLVAVYHHKNDIAIGNIVGSNIFNVFWILGLTSTILPLPFSLAINFDVLVGIIVTMLLFLFMFVSSRHKLDRWQGGMFVILYFLYIFYLIQRG